MAINRALMKRQMYNMGGPTLQAGAPDLRLTGDQRDRGTYTQRRRNQMAYGGIAGLDGRKRYGIGSWFQENIKDPIEMAITGKTQEQIDANHSWRTIDTTQAKELAITLGLAS